MTVWWMTLAATYILGILCRVTAKPVLKNGDLHYHNNVVIAGIACAILILVAGLREGIGDTAAYIEGYLEYPTGIKNVFSYLLNEEGKDKGFYALAMLLKTFVSEEPQAYIFSLSLFTITFIFIRFYKSTELIDLAVWLFITTGCYLVTMNGMRQYLVSAILFLAYPWIQQKKWYLYLPLVLLTSSMHGSALIFIPVYFIANCPAWGTVTKLILVGGSFLYVTYPVTGPMIAELLQESQYDNYGTLVTSEGAGANLIRVFVMAVPIVLAYLGRDMLKGKEKYYNVVFHMSLLNFIFILLANRYWIYARFNMYFSLYMILLIIWCVKYLFDVKNTKLVYIFCIGLYGFYYYYEMVISLNQPYTSNYIKF